jgi:transcriptional regulator with XRE-family HTH domain
MDGMSNDICIQFGERLRRLRERKGFNQLQFSERCGIENSHLSRLESGKREPGLYMLEIIAKGLGVTVAELMRGL